MSSLKEVSIINIINESVSPGCGEGLLEFWSKTTSSGVSQECGVLRSWARGVPGFEPLPAQWEEISQHNGRGGLLTWFLGVPCLCPAFWMCLVQFHVCSLASPMKCCEYLVRYINSSGLRHSLFWPLYSFGQLLCYWHHLLVKCQRATELTLFCRLKMQGDSILILDFLFWQGEKESSTRLTAVGGCWKKKVEAWLWFLSCFYLFALL